MGYAIMRLDRIKTEKQFKDTHHHNERIYNVTNADDAKRELNESLVELEQADYRQAFEDTVYDMKRIGALDRSIRKDAVRGFEVILRFSEEDIDKIDIDAWKEANLAWLDKTFNPPDHEIHFTDKRTGEEMTEKINNVKAVTLHMDEHVPHIHAFIVPIDDKGHLNSKFYLGGGRGRMIALQDDYAEAMGQFGLQRGEPHTVATPQQISRYYNNITKAVEAKLPEVEIGETAEAYKERAEDVYQTALSVKNDEKVKMNQRIIAEKSKLYEERGALLDIARDIGVERITRQGLQDVRKDAKDMRTLKAAIEEHPDRNRAQELQRTLEEFLEWERARERRRENQRERKRSKEER